jgi:carboxymethylenebutenolidase
MKAMGKSYSGTNYEGAIHGFLRAQDDPKAPTPQCDEACVAKERADNLAATKDAWPKTVAFLKKNLGVK